MGLDNGFIARKKENSYVVDIDLAHFRNYYELDDYIRSCTYSPDGYEFLVSAETIREIEKTIKDIAKTLLSTAGNTVDFYDEQGYPEEMQRQFYGNPFDPSMSRSSFAGRKLIRLYETTHCLQDIIENNPDNVYIAFYSSF